MNSNFLDEAQAAWLDVVNKFMDDEITVEYVRKCDVGRSTRTRRTRRSPRRAGSAS